ncbi:MAG: TIGR00296 family protein [Thaumarchaeota archaeon]|nr:TIGR00296 family protein [Nitrososphaerota archaeon]
MSTLTIDEGEFLVRLARKSIEEHLSGRRVESPTPPSERLAERRGVFVTLYRYPSKELRGCIGLPYPTHRLVDAVIHAAISSATADPRFPPVRLKEMDEIVIEVSVLTKPEEIKYDDPKKLPEKIVIGRDGLIIEAGGFSGLLLPQVPVEYNWTPEEYLMHLSLKAGLPSTYWLTGRARIYRFTAQIFAEKTPRGEIVEEKLTPKR